jgi:hypothetical protein
MARVRVVKSVRATPRTLPFFPSLVPRGIVSSYQPSREVIGHGSVAHIASNPPRAPVTRCACGDVTTLRITPSRCRRSIGYHAGDTPNRRLPPI